MAGVTDPAFRGLCARYGSGLFVSEMVMARGVVEANAGTLALCARTLDLAGRGSWPLHSTVQLSGTDPVLMGRAVEILVGEHGVDHVDLNMGCPVPKVTRRGGGAALPWKSARFAAVVSAAVRAAELTSGGRVGVSVKMRLGIDAAHLTVHDAARAAEDAGVRWIAIHGRTAAQRYDGAADWRPIAEVVAAVSVPVLGNGDVWSAHDAVQMMAETGCAGVVVGRACLGRPWLFAELDAQLRTGDASAGAQVLPRRGGVVIPTTVGQVLDVVREHLEVHVAHDVGRGGSELHAVTRFRKHLGWYLDRLPIPPELLARLATVADQAQVNRHLDEIRALVGAGTEQVDLPVRPKRSAVVPGAPAVLPAGWLDSRDGGWWGADDTVGGSGG